MDFVMVALKVGPKPGVGTRKKYEKEWISSLAGIYNRMEK